MIHLKIEQENNIETVDSKTVSLLYKLCTENTLDGTSNLKGNLYTQYAYKVESDYLNNRFEDLTITVLTDYYFKFEDPEVTKVLSDGFSGGSGLTETQLTQIGSTNMALFSGNTKIERFMELKTKLPNFKYTNTTVGLFKNCTNLKYVTIKDSQVQGNWSVFDGCNNLRYVDITHDDPNGVFQGWFQNSKLDTIDWLPNGITTIGNDFVSGSTVQRLVFPDSVTSYYGKSLSNAAIKNCYIAGNPTFSDMFMHGSNVGKLYMNVATPPTGFTFGYMNIDKIFVPIGCAATYIATEPWATKFGSSKIFEYDFTTDPDNIKQPYDYSQPLQDFQIYYDALNSQITAIITPTKCGFRFINWEIISGQEYATLLNEKGLLMIKEGADASNIVIKGTDDYTKTITKTATIPVTYTGKVKLDGHFFKTGISLASDMSYKFKFNTGTTNIPGQRGLLGAGDVSFRPEKGMFAVFEGDAQITFSAFGKVTFNYSKNTDYEVELKTGSVIINGTTYTPTGTPSLYAREIFIGNTCFQTTGQSYSVIGPELYYFQIYQGGVLIKDYVPINSRYMYNKIDGTLLEAQYWVDYD